MTRLEAIKALIESHYAEFGSPLFSLLVDVGDMYLAELEDKMPKDKAESDFLFSLMPIEVVMAGLEDNLVERQDTGVRMLDGEPT